jgi:general nucleoside transport system permease protein
VPPLLKLRRGVDEVISTIMLNFVASAAVISYLVQGPLMESGAAIPRAMRSPTSPACRVSFPGAPAPGRDGRAAAGLAVAFAVHRTRLRLPAPRHRPQPARRASRRLPGHRQALLALVLGGALAGLAGGIEVAA